MSAGSVPPEAVREDLFHVVSQLLLVCWHLWRSLNAGAMGTTDRRQTRQERGHTPAFLGSWIVISVLQTVVCSLAGGQPAGLWAAWRHPRGSSLGKSASGKTTNTSAGPPSLAPGGWCLLPTASMSESASLRAQSPPRPCIPPAFHSGNATFPGCLQSPLELT